jgi:S-adenosylmethionine:tRNA ribosyltransferase-isomerase
MSLVSDFDFELPDDLIAQQARPRGASRLLVVDRAGKTWHETTIRELPRWLAPGDLIVANDTRVFPARLIGRRDPSGGRAECFLIERVDDDRWLALVNPGRTLQPGARIVCEQADRAPGVRLLVEVLDRYPSGRRLLALHAEGADSSDAAIEAVGHVPLPPYIRRPDEAEDRARYQTVYAEARGSVAAPTAGLHFDAALVAAIGQAGISWATITLHVGYGTFKPVRVDRVEDHVVDAEHYVIPADTAEAIRQTLASGHRVVAVGTTTTRALESAARSGNEGSVVRVGAAATDLFIRPGHRFQVVDGLLTNFHLPKSSLLMLVAALAGRDLLLAAYRHAVSARFRFYSYGDAMLVI